MQFFQPITDPYYERQYEPPDEAPDIADWADEIPDDPFEHPLLATAHSVSELLPGYHVAGTDTWEELRGRPPQRREAASGRKQARQQGELFEEVA